MEFAAGAVKEATAEKDLDLAAGEALDRAADRALAERERRAKPAIVVTGASSGIGRAISRLAAREGEVVLVARSKERLQEVAAEIAAAGGRAQVLPLDLTAPGAAEAIDSFLTARELYCDILVNNAGAGIVGPAFEIDRARQMAIVDLNVRAMADLSLFFLRGMIERRSGGILHVASVAGLLPGPFMAVYYASKAFGVSFSQALWEECRDTGVKICTLCPGPVETEFFERATGGKKKPKLFRLLPGAQAGAVAEAGWRGLKENRRMVVPGLMPRLGAFALRFAPTRPLFALLRKAQKRAPK